MAAISPSAKVAGSADDVVAEHVEHVFENHRDQDLVLDDENVPDARIRRQRSREQSITAVMRILEPPRTGG